MGRKRKKQKYDSLPGLVNKASRPSSMKSLSLKRFQSKEKLYVLCDPKFLRSEDFNLKSQNEIYRLFIHFLLSLIYTNFVLL